MFHPIHTLTSKQCTETKGRSFAHGLVYTLSAAKAVIIKFPSLPKSGGKIYLPDQTDLIKYDSNKS
jgi:hypothetical protein